MITEKKPMIIIEPEIFILQFDDTQCQIIEEVSLSKILP